LNGDFSNFENVTENQFEVQRYHSHGKLTYKMAV
jgi:hypothetical protein